MVFLLYLYIYFYLHLLVFFIYAMGLTSKFVQRRMLQTLIGCCKFLMYVLMCILQHLLKVVLVNSSQVEACFCHFLFTFEFIVSSNNVSAVCILYCYFC